MDTNRTENPGLFRMKPCMRWYGPHDAVTLVQLRQAGAEGIVTALHQIPTGAVWDKESIRRRQELIRKAGMRWEVVESLPVHEAIKQQRGAYRDYTEKYVASLRNLGACGLRVVAYNFMPVLDWVRTDLAFPNPDTTRTLRFDRLDFAYFDIHLLKRPGAESDYSPEILEALEAHRKAMQPDRSEAIRRAVLQGLPGSDEHFTESRLLSLLSEYDGISSEQLRENLLSFLRIVLPAAAESGVRLAIHPDDPPYPLLGLPRVVSTQADLETLFTALPEEENGLCYCTGSLGAGKENDLRGILNAFKSRIHFLHLRNIEHEDRGAFRESPHLQGHVPMSEVVSGILRLMQERRVSLPMRPDHGVLFDLEEKTGAYPGYSLIGRMKGLSELRGLELGLSQAMHSSL